MLARTDKLLFVQLSGAILGRSGVHLHNVRTESGAKVSLKDVVPGVSDRLITVTGSVEQVNNARLLLQMW